LEANLLGVTPPERYVGGAVKLIALTESCPKTATYRSRRCGRWQPDAVGRHDFNLKIDIGSYRGPPTPAFRRQYFWKGKP
jgi:hypothetical protein